jgi:hypothetical protein
MGEGRREKGDGRRETGEREHVIPRERSERGIP